jgi:acyl-CoA hydrolase
MTVENTHVSGITSILNNYKSRIVSAEEAVKCIKSYDKILIHSNCAFPAKIVEALVKRKNELEQVEIYHALTVGELPYLRPGMEGHFIHNATYIGSNSREAVQDGRADFITIFL